MISVDLVNAYLCANVLIGATALALAGIRAASPLIPVRMSSRHRLRLAYLLASFAVILPFVKITDGNAPLVPPVATIWAALSMHVEGVPSAQDHRLEFAPLSNDAPLPLLEAGTVLKVLIVGGLGAWLGLLLVHYLRACRLLRRAVSVRRIGRLSVLVSEDIEVPLSFWRPAGSAVLIPQALLDDGRSLRIAIRHEAQHHRQGDTQLIYVLQLLRGLMFWNPAAHLLVRQVLELQEFACDEAVTTRPGTGALAYCDCLIRVARVGAGPVSLLQQAMASRSAEFLRERVSAVMAPPAHRLGRGVACLIGMVLVVAMGAISEAGASLIGDRRIEADAARQMAWQLRQSTAFPTAINDAVTGQLNRLLGTPDGRAYLRNALRRMDAYRSVIDGKLRDSGLPMELLAVPLVESGYRNLPKGANPRHGAGLWMFIASTARAYGLHVSDHRDERLDIERETEAASAMLSELLSRFGDWQLALLAYNTGPERVEEGIRALGTRDAWRLVEAGYRNDPDYLARTMAAIIILGNLPSLCLDEGE